MALPPIKSTNLPVVPALDDVMGNHTAGGITNTGRMSVSGLVNQLMSQGSLGSRFNGIDARLDVLGASTGDPELLATLAEDIQTTRALADQVTKLSFDGIGVVDRSGFLGTPAVYLPQSIILANSDRIIIQQVLAATAGYPSRVQVPLAATSGLQAVYYDIADNAYKVATWPARMPANPQRYFHIISIYGNQEAFTSEHEFVSTRDRSGSSMLCNQPFAWEAENKTLYIPTMSGWSPSNGTWRFRPANSESHKRIVIANPSDVTFVWVDIRDLLVNGESSATAIKTAEGYTTTNMRPARFNPWMVLLGCVFANRFVSAHPDLKVADVVENQFGFGREDNDRADHVYLNSAPVPLTRPESLALGFTRGYSNPTTHPFYGGKLRESRNAGFIFVRWYAETDTAGVFGTQRFFAQGKSTAGVTLNTAFAGVLARVISDHVREYYSVVPITNGDTFDTVWAGAWQPPTFGIIRIFGVQIYAGTNQNPWIAHADYPRASVEIGARLRALENPTVVAENFEPMMPTHVFVHPTRPYAWYPSQMFGHTEKVLGELVVSSSKTGVATPAFTATSRTHAITLDPARLGSTATFAFIPLSGSRVSRKVFEPAVKVLSPSAIAALNIRSLQIGDSLNNTTGCYVHSIARFREMGGTITPIGTMSIMSIIPTDGTELGEARNGREYADYIYMNTDGLIPVENTTEDWAAYMALGTSGKRDRNPFLKVPNADDIANRADMIYNGYIFDLRYYLTRSGQSDPHIVDINLHTNDISQQDPARSLLQIREGFRIMVAQTRRALPAAKIFIHYNSLGRYSSEERWSTEHWAGLKAIIKAIRDLADPNVILIPNYATINRDNGFPTTFTLDEYGTQVSTVSDPIHYNEHGVKEYAEVTAQYWAGMLTP